MRFFARILDFGNGRDSNHVVVSTYYDGRSYIGFWVLDEDKHSSIGSNTELNVNQWYHVAVSLKNNTGNIYVNGHLDKEGYLYSPKPVLRTWNFIGKSNWNDENADAIYDELKIFDRALLPEEINYEASLNRTLFRTQDNSSNANSNKSNSIDLVK